MYEPPFDPSPRTDSDQLTWRRVLANFALAAVMSFGIWAVSYPVYAAVLVAGTTLAVVATRRARRLARCVEECRGLAMDLPGTVDITVTWGSRCDAC